MEKRKVESLLIVCLVLGLLVGQSTAAFKDCYESCFIICFIAPGNKLVSCAAKCLKDYIFTPNLHALNLKDTQYFCKHGCATSLCTNLSTKNNPAGEKVEGCVVPARRPAARIDPSPSYQYQEQPCSISLWLLLNRW